MDFSNTLTWVKGNHTFAFGGQLKKIETISDSVGLFMPTVGLGVATGDNAVLNAFRNTGANPTLPGATNAELANAQALYAVLSGRVSTFGANAVLGADGKYHVNGSRHFEIQENTNGLFAQDQWRLRPNLTLNFGIRWQPQTGAKMNTANFALLTDPNMVFDVSGPGNLFSPGTLTGQVPTVTRQHHRREGVQERHEQLCAELLVWCGVRSTAQALARRSSAKPEPAFSVVAGLVRSFVKAR